MKASLVLIYSEKISNRLRYAAEVLFKSVMLTDVSFTSDLEEFNAFKGAKINYSKQQDLPGIQIYPAKLLFERSINEKNPTIGHWDGEITLFSNQKELRIPFDALAATFYLVSRYEEYIPHRTDRFGRFRAEDSFAFKNGFLHLPLVDIWAGKIAETVKTIFPKTEFGDKKYQYTPTVDIDSAFAYKQKGLMRTLGGFAKDLSKLEFTNLVNRWNCVVRGKEDPFDTYEFMKVIHDKYETHPIFFFLLADYGLNDKGVTYRSKPFQNLIKSVSDYHDVGIHPGFQSNIKTEKLGVEIDRLASIIHKPVHKSRQHFLMLDFPATFKRLSEQGIRDEYSMGFASQIGFRASTATPYPFYDLEEEMATNVTIYPFAFMDTTFNQYLNLTPEAAFEEAKKTIDQVKAVNGTLISLWHNESLGEKWQWKGWRDLYERIVAYAAN